MYIHSLSVCFSESGFKQVPKQLAGCEQRRVDMGANIGPPQENHLVFKSANNIVDVNIRATGAGTANHLGDPIVTW